MKIKLPNGVEISPKTKNKPDNDIQIENVMKTETYQFDFEGGVFMATINSNLHTPFSLKHYSNKTNNFEDFKLEVQKFLDYAGYKMTENDSIKLQAHYNKYV